MARRFGRNQRRALREEVARLAKETVRLTDVAGMHHRAAIRYAEQAARVERELIDWSDSIVALLGDTSAFARQMATQDIDASLFVSITQEGRPFKIAPVDGALHPTHPRHIAAVFEARRIVDLFAVCAGVDSDAIRFQRRFFIRAPDGSFEMIMDERTLRHLRQSGDAGLRRYLLDRMMKPWEGGRG